MGLLIFLCIGEQSYGNGTLIQVAQGRVWPVPAKTQDAAPFVMKHNRVLQRTVTNGH